MVTLFSSTASKDLPRLLGVFACKGQSNIKSFYLVRQRWFTKNETKQKNLNRT